MSECAIAPAPPAVCAVGVDFASVFARKLQAQHPARGTSVWSLHAVKAGGGKVGLLCTCGTARAADAAEANDFFAMVMICVIENLGIFAFGGCGLAGGITWLSGHAAVSWSVAWHLVHKSGTTPLRGQSDVT